MVRAMPETMTLVCRTLLQPLPRLRVVSNFKLPNPSTLVPNTAANVGIRIGIGDPAWLLALLNPVRWQLVN